MEVILGIVGAVTTWLLSTGLFVLLDNLFSLTEKMHWMALVFFGVPVLLALIAYYASPTLFSVLGKLLWGAVTKAKQRNKNGQMNRDNSDAIDGTPTHPITTEKKSVSHIKKTKQTAPPDWMPKIRKSSYFYTPGIKDGCPLIYFYPNVFLTDLDVEFFDEICESGDFSVDATPNEDGGINIEKNGKFVGKTEKFGKMLSDWQAKNEPTVFGISETREGKEAVALGFYRDTEGKLSGCKMETVRLVKNRSSDLQFALSLLDDGEALTCSDDYIEETGSLVVFSAKHREVGSLPKKFNKIYAENGISGIYVDHVDEDENEKFTGFVRVYW